MSKISHSLDFCSKHSILTPLIKITLSNNGYVDSLAEIENYFNNFSLTDFKVFIECRDPLPMWINDILYKTVNGFKQARDEFLNNNIDVKDKQEKFLIKFRYQLNDFYFIKNSINYCEENKVLKPLTHLMEKFFELTYEDLLNLSLEDLQIIPPYVREFIWNIYHNFSVDKKLEYYKIISDLDYEYATLKEIFRRYNITRGFDFGTFDGKFSKGYLDGRIALKTNEYIVFAYVDSESINYLWVYADGFSLSVLNIYENYSADLGYHSFDGNYYESFDTSNVEEYL